jgi:uncharacterized SAM-binding protein YcdF (DUF218 family)
VKRHLFSRRTLLFSIGLALAIAAAIGFAYRPLLRFSTRFLIIDSEPSAADAIIILGGGEPGRAREAVDLYRSKLAPYVAVMTEPPPMDSDGLKELRQYGIELVGSNENYLRILRGMEIPDENIVVVNESAADTFEELRRVRELCEQRGWSTILIVTSNYHTRRTHLVAGHVLEPDVRTTVIASKYGGIDRRDWWTRTGELRTFLIEFQKLVAYTFYIWPLSIWTTPDDTKASSISSECPGLSWMLRFSSTFCCPDPACASETTLQAWAVPNGRRF